jgi:septum site-determining protein MinD
MDMDAICAITEKTKQWQVQALKNILNAKKQLELANIDFIIFDVTPGVEQMALNAIVASDCVLTVLKPDQYGIEGTKQLIQSIYKKLDHDVKLIENKCFEEVHKRIDDVPVIDSIPCMCDVSKNGDKKIYTLDEPTHPFSLEIAKIAQILTTL